MDSRIWSEVQKTGGFTTREGELLAHYDWTTFWSYVYAPDGTKIGEAKCIAFGVFVLQVLQATLPDFWINREYAGYLGRTAELD